MVKRRSSQAQKGVWKTGIAEEDVVGKEGLQEVFELLGGALFHGEDAC